MNGNKIVGGGAAGGGVGAAVVYVLGRFGINLNAEDGALIAAGLIAVGAFVVHNGLAGAFRVIWKGAGSVPQQAAQAAQDAVKQEAGLSIIELLVVLVAVGVLLLLLGRHF